jgi:hypothetical protein
VSILEKPVLEKEPVLGKPAYLEQWFDQALFLLLYCGIVRIGSHG